MSGVTDPDRRISIDPDLICDFSDLISFGHLFKSGSDLLRKLPVRIIVLVLDGISEIDAHLRRGLSYLICLRHFIYSSTMGGIL